MNDKKLDLFHYMNACNDPEASDGAWQAMLESAVEVFNADNSTDYDPFDSWHEWMAWTADEPSPRNLLT